MPPSLRTTALVAALGIAFDLAANGQAPGASVPLFVAAVAIALRATLPRTVERDALLAGAVAIAACIAFRDDEALVTLDVLASAALLALAATGPGAVALRARQTLARMVRLARGAFAAPAFLAAPVAAAFGGVRAPRLRPALRACAVTIPVLAVLTALLASADAVFASIVVPRLPRLRLGSVAGHVALAGIGTALCGTLWAAAASPRTETPPPARAPRILGPAEWGGLLGGMAALFTAFLGVQFSVLFAGRGVLVGGPAVRERFDVLPGVSYAAYARSGFFQLLAVAAISAVVVLAVWDLGRRESRRHRRVFAWLATTIAALCGVMLASAAARLDLYQEEFGWTLTRLAAGFAMAWIGAVLLLLVAAIWRRRRERVLSGAVAAALAVLVAANLLGPVGFVARRNAERLRAGHGIDAAYLAWLGTDAAPALLAVLPALRGEDAEFARAGLCELRERLEADPGWRSWNLARVRARTALRGFAGCGTPPTASGSP